MTLSFNPSYETTFNNRLGSLYDVNLPQAPLVGHVLSHNGTHWTSQPGGSSVALCNEGTTGDTLITDGVGPELKIRRIIPDGVFVKTRVIDDGLEVALDPLDIELGMLGNVDNTAPTSNQVLKWNGTAWAPATDSEGVQFADFVNTGTDGVGVHTGTDADFRHVAPGSDKISVTLNGADIDVDVVESNLSLSNLGDTTVANPQASDILVYSVANGWVNTPSSTFVGETNTASTVGVGGVGVFKQKTGVDLEFKSINAGSSKVTVTDDAGNNEVDVDVDPAQINLADLGTKVINNLDDVTVTAPSSGQVLNYNGTAWVNAAPAPSGETNTASTVGVGGVGVFKQKTGVNLEFKSINAGSTKVTVTDDVGNNEVDVDVDPAQINLADLGTKVIDNLDDVTVTAVANGDLLQYVSGNSRWENKASSGVNATFFRTDGNNASSAATGVLTLANTAVSGRMWFQVGSDIALQISKQNMQMLFDPDYVFQASGNNNTTWRLRGQVPGGAVPSGSIEVSTVDGSGIAGSSGSISFVTGLSPGTGNTTSGSINFTTGNSSAGNPGFGVGDIILSTGTALGTNTDGGSIVLNASAATGTGNHGQVILSSASGGDVVLEADGTLSTTTANYETLVTGDDDIPNKKYVDDSITAQTLTQHADVSLTAPAEGQFIRLRSGNWVNETKSAYHIYYKNNTTSQTFSATNTDEWLMFPSGGFFTQYPSADFVTTNDAGRFKIDYSGITRGFKVSASMTIEKNSGGTAQYLVGFSLNGSIISSGNAKVLEFRASNGTFINVGLSSVVQLSSGDILRGVMVNKDNTDTVLGKHFSLSITEI